MGSKIALTCPAQGSPIPSFRLDFLLMIFVQNPLDQPNPNFHPFWSYLLSPKLQGKVQQSHVQLRGCLYLHSGRISFDPFLQNLLVCQCPSFQPVQKLWVHSKLIWDKKLHCFVQLRENLFQHSGQSLQSFTFDVFVEPIGSAKPKFASKLDSLTFTKYLSNGIALTCPAQGSPIPAFRLVELHFENSKFLEPIGGASPKFSHESKTSSLFKSNGESISLACPAQAFPVPAFRLV